MVFGPDRGQPGPPNWERSTDARPGLVADQYLWHLSAALFCVGPGEQPGRFEWELRSGASLATLDSVRPLTYYLLTLQKTDEGDRTGSFCPPCLLRSKNGGRAKPTGAAGGRHNLGTNDNLEHPPQCQVHVKTGAPTRIGAAAFRFEWIAAGFTAVCFWTAPSHLVSGLEGPVRFRARPGLHTGPIESESVFSRTPCAQSARILSCPTEN